MKVFPAAEYMHREVYLRQAENIKNNVTIQRYFS